MSVQNACVCGGDGVLCQCGSESAANPPPPPLILSQVQVSEPLVLVFLLPPLPFFFVLL